MYWITDGPYFLQRYVIVANGHTVDKIFVEADPTKYTITGADSVLAHL
jgi:peroxiredoxin